MKTCAKCGEEKDREEFSPDRRKRDGLYSRCKFCRREDSREYREENREHVRQSQMDWVKKNPGKVNVSNRNWRGANRFSVAMQQSRSVAKKRGYLPCSATAEEIEYAFTGKCEMCGVPEMELNKKLQMDHNHETGEFRGFLCGKCNKALGLLNDSRELLTNALRYLTTCEVW